MTSVPTAMIFALVISAAAAPTLLARRDWQSGFWATLTALASLAGFRATSGWLQ